jgi:hypothetical protein
MLGSNTECTAGGPQLQTLDSVHMGMDTAHRDIFPVYNNVTSMDYLSVNGAPHRVGWGT